MSVCMRLTSQFEMSTRYRLLGSFLEHRLPSKNGQKHSAGEFLKTCPHPRDPLKSKSGIKNFPLLIKVILFTFKQGRSSCRPAAPVLLLHPRTAQCQSSLSPRSRLLDHGDEDDDDSHQNSEGSLCTLILFLNIFDCLQPRCLLLFMHGEILFFFFFKRVTQLLLFIVFPSSLSSMGRLVVKHCYCKRTFSFFPQGNWAFLSGTHGRVDSSITFNVENKNKSN